MSLSDAKGNTISTDLEETDSESDELEDENATVGVPSVSYTHLTLPTTMWV